MKSFKNKVVVITGAGSGIGQALAIAFAERGARLALNDYNEDALKKTVRLLGVETIVLTDVFDVSNKEAMFDFATKVLEHYKQVDIMINNAGVALGSWTADEVSLEDYEWIVNINMWSVVYGSLAFLPHLRQQKESSLVNVSSLFGLFGVPRQVPYSMCKFAVSGFSEGLYIEERMQETGVAISCVYPGGTKTNLSKNLRGNSQQIKTIKKFEKVLANPPQTAAEAIIKGIRKKEFKIVVGTDAKIIDKINLLSKPLLSFALEKIAKSI